MFDEFRGDENGKVVMDEGGGKGKIEGLGGYEKLYGMKVEGDYVGKVG